MNVLQKSEIQMRLNKLWDSLAGSELLLIGIIVLAARVVINLWINSQGYYFGNDPDTFYRLGFSWLWSQKPFFIFGYWTPFQFWLCGLTFAVLEPIISGATPMVPVFWNHLFFAGTAILIYSFSRRIGDRYTGFIALTLLITFGPDIKATYSGVSEPILIFFGVLLSFSIYRVHEIYRPPKKLLYIAAISTFFAAATHYLGWFLIPGFLILMIVPLAAKLAKGEDSLIQPSDIALSLLAAVLFPIIWSLATFIEYGDPLRFLSQASQFHAEFAGSALTYRSTALLRALWKLDPIILLLAAVALFHQFAKGNKALFFFLPGLGYLLVLFVVGVSGLAVPDLQSRYVLFPFIVAIPFIALEIRQAAKLTNRFSLIVSLILLSGIGIYGVHRASVFINWVDQPARQAASAIERQIEESNKELSIYIEPENCLYPTAGIANSISRPDWVETIYNPGQAPIVRDPSTYDIALTMNPFSTMRFSTTHRILDVFGDYSLFIEGGENEDPYEKSVLSEGWHPLNKAQIQQVSSAGTIFFAFNSAGEIGDSVGLEKELNVDPNSCYIISASVQDWYQRNDRPWIFVQQLVANNIVLWSHDIGSEGSCVSDVNHYLMPTGNSLRVELRTLAIGDPISSADWQLMSLTGVQNLKVRECSD